MFSPWSYESSHDNDKYTTNMNIRLFFFMIDLLGVESTFFTKIAKTVKRMWDEILTLSFSSPDRLIKSMKVRFDAKLMPIRGK